MKWMIVNWAKFLLMSLLVFLGNQGFGQKDKNLSQPDSGKTKAQNISPSKTSAKTYEEVITDKATSSYGLFAVHKIDEKWYFEIPVKLLGKDFLTVSRISKSAVGVRVGLSGYAGDEINENVVRFEKGPNNRLFLKNISYQESSRDSLGGMYWNVINSNMQPIIASYEIKTYSSDSNTIVIDVTELVAGDNEILYFDNSVKRRLGLSGAQADKSYVSAIKSYPENIEIKAVKTYSRSANNSFGNSSTSNNAQNATFELNSSIVLLPEAPMKPRYFDERVGYFTTQAITDFDLNPQGIERVRYIRRFRLEPRPEDIDKYRRGELVDPKKPIVFYIDPTTPKKWIPYLQQGVNDWQLAFEQAGFKNAIYAKPAPNHMEDSTWSIDDARHNAIIYKPSEIANAEGPSIIDPRSGEVLEAHINWYHNVMSLLRNWYFIQASAVDPKARQLVYDDSLMGALIRTSVSHEVGHTLGLLHNFGSSSSVAVEKLRDKNFVASNGHTPSIMDYARYNYVAQPEDGIAPQDLLPRIGDYDKWAIEWGYRWLPEFRTADEERNYLNELTIKKLQNKRLYWGDGETYRDDPRNQMEDLGDNPMMSGSYGVKNLQRITEHLVEWTSEPGHDYSSLREMYSQLIAQFARYSNHVTTNIGGIERTAKRVEQAGPVYEYTDRARQQQAMQWLNDYVFVTPEWLIKKEILQLANANPQNIVGGVQDKVLGALLNPATMGRLLRFEVEDPANAYTASDMLAKLRKSIFQELVTKKPIDMYRRNLQKSFTEKLLGLTEVAQGGLVITIGGGGGSTYQQGVSKTNDGISLAKACLRQLQSDIKMALANYSDASSRYHLMDLNDRIETALHPK